MSTCASAIGMSTGPIDRKGCPKASTLEPSTHVTVPVAAMSMSPVIRTVAIADPGSSRRGATGGPAEPPEGTAIHPPEADRRPASPLESAPPEKETGSGRGAMAPASTGRKTDKSPSRPAEKWPSRNASSRAAVDTVDPAIGTGAAAGALRMSSMLWIGVMPQIAILGEGPTVCQRPDELAVDVDRAAAHAGDDSGVLEPGARHARQDHVLPGRDPFDGPDDLDVEALNTLAVAEVAQAVALHSGQDPIRRQDLGRLRENGSARQRQQRREQETADARRHTKHNAATANDHSL